MDDLEPRAAYSANERRIVDYLMSKAPDIGGGDDPVGFLIAAHASLIAENRELLALLAVGGCSAPKNCCGWPTNTATQWCCDWCERRAALLASASTQQGYTAEDESGGIKDVDSKSRMRRSKKPREETSGIKDTQNQGEPTQNGDVS